MKDCDIIGLLSIGFMLGMALTFWVACIGESYRDLEKAPGYIKLVVIIWFISCLCAAVGIVTWLCKHIHWK